MDRIKIVLAICPMCGVIFPHRAKTRAASVNKCCGAKCSANMRVGKQPICAPDEIEAKTVSFQELKALEADVQVQREAMRMAGQQVKEHVAIEQVRQVSNMYEERMCAHCGVKFTLLKSKVRQGNGKYCNSACYHASALKKSPYVANGKMAFDDADKAQAFIADLMSRGYRFWAKGKSPVLQGSDFYGVQWHDTYEGKLFFTTKRRDVYRTYATTK